MGAVNLCDYYWSLVLYYFQEETTLKRPKLPLVVNAKIPTKLRQRYLDAFIDEHMKMACPPEQAYKKVKHACCYFY